jgi:excisionase family DNA binding protein
MSTEAVADGRLTISLREAAALIGVSPGTIRTLHDNQTLPGYEVGKRLRFKRADIEAWLESRRKIKHAPAAVAPEATPGRAASSGPAVSDLDAEIRATRRKKGQGAR